MEPGGGGGGGGGGGQWGHLHPQNLRNGDSPHHHHGSGMAISLLDKKIKSITNFKKDV